MWPVSRRCGMRLQQTDRIADDQPVLIELVVAEVPTNGRVAPFNVEVFERAALHGVAQFAFPAPFLAVGDCAGVHVVAADVAVHQGQTGDAEGDEVVVMPYLPGFFFRIVITGVVTVVGQGAAAGAIDPHPPAVASEFLQANVEGVAAVFGREQARPGLVVQIAGPGTAIFLAIEETQVGAEGPVADGLAVNQVRKKIGRAHN